MKFDLLPTIDGWEVIETATGRAIDRHEREGAARSRCDELNRAATLGTRGLEATLATPSPRARRMALEGARVVPW